MKVRIYQIDHEHDKNQVKFMNYGFTQAHGGILPESYRCVYSGELDAYNLEKVYEKFNTGRPARFFGHSLSVSDLVEITEDTPITRKGVFFCDSIGFRKVEVDTSSIRPVDGVRCLMLLPGKAPEEVRIPDRLEAWQNSVSDHGEESLMEVSYPFNDNAVVVGNEEAKLIPMQGNRHIGGQVYAGPLFLVGDDGMGEFCDLTDAQIKKYTELFANPEDISPEEVEADLGFYFCGE